MDKLILLIIVPFIVASCGVDTTGVEGGSADTVRCCSEDKRTNDHLLFATLYHQQAPEYKALCRQAYNVGMIELQGIMSITDFELPPAVVLDLDETVLDNSPFTAKCILENTNYPEYWEEWINAANAELIPGVKEFLEFADELGVEIYYISNRKEKYLGQTIVNMKLYDLPNADSAHIFLRKNTTSKKARRDQLATQRSIVMLIGDNLNDFTEDFEVTTNEERTELVQKNSDMFGSKYIVLPNPMYGEWEEVVLEGTYENERNVRDSLYRVRLKGF